MGEQWLSSAAFGLRLIPDSSSVDVRNHWEIVSSCVQKAKKKHTKGTRNVTKEGDADVGESSRVLFDALFCVMSALGPLQKIRRTRGDRL